IAAGGPDAFYTGWIADHIADDMAAHGGLITKADLAAYRAKARSPIRTSFLGYDVVSMPPPSSGGVALTGMLHMLEGLRIQKTARLSPTAIHLEVEAMRRAFLDRARFLGDEDFVKVPVARLTSFSHARDLIRSVDPAKASSSAVLGKDIVSVSQAPEPS